MSQQLLLPVSRSSYAEICESDHCHSSQSFCHHRRIKDTHRVLQYDQAALKGSRMDPESLAPDATESSIGKTTSIPWFDNMVSCILTSVNSSIRCPELYETSSDKLSCFKENESGHKRSRRGLSYDDRTRSGSINLKKTRRDGEVSQPQSWRVENHSSSSVAHPSYALEQSYILSFEQCKTEVPASQAYHSTSDITVSVYPM
jgi:hypothetical protein